MKLLIITIVMAAAIVAAQIERVLLLIIIILLLEVEALLVEEMEDIQIPVIQVILVQKSVRHLPVETVRLLRLELLLIVLYYIMIFGKELMDLMTLVVILVIGIVQKVVQLSFIRKSKYLMPRILKNYQMPQSYFVHQICRLVIWPLVQVN